MIENRSDFLTCILATDPGKDSNTDVNVVVKNVVFIVGDVFVFFWKEKMNIYKLLDADEN